MVLVFVAALQSLDGLQRTDQRHATTGHHAFFDRRTGGVQRIFDAGLLLFHFDFGSSTDFDDRHTTGQLGNALLQLFLVVIGGGFFDLPTNLLDPTLNLVGPASAVDDGGVFFGNHNLAGSAQIGQGRFLQAQTDFLGDHLTAGQDGDILQHGFATIAETRCLDCCDLDDTANGVHHQGGQRFAFDILGDDQQRPTGLGDAFQDWQQVAHIGNFLVVQKNVRRFQFRAHALLVVDEIGGDVTTIKLHALYDIQFVVQTLAFLDRDHAFFANFLHGVGDDLTDGIVGVGGNGANLGDGFVVSAGLGQLAQFFDGGDYRLVDTTLEIHGVHASSDGLHAFANDGLGQHGGSGGAVTSNVGSLGSDFLHHLGAHVLELIF